MRSFTEPYFDCLRDLTDAVILILGTIAESGKNPSQRARTKPGKRPAIGKAASAGQKRIEDASRIASFSLTGLWSAKTPSGFKSTRYVEAAYLMNSGGDTEASLEFW